MTVKKKVLLFHPTIHETGVNYLKSQEDIEVVLAPDSNIDTIYHYIEDADGVIARFEIMSADVMDRAKHLKVIGVDGVGVDNIDVSAATARNIAVVNAPLANYVSVAEHVVMYVLALFRRLRLSDIAVRSNNFNYRDENPPREASGKNVYLIGFGRNARETARILKAMNLNVRAYDPYVTKEQVEGLGVEYVTSFYDGFRGADVVSLHLPLNEKTYRLINAQVFDQMRDCYFINCARGPLVDYNALYNALQDGRVAYAGLDVFDPEPPNADDKILKHPNVICTPHTAGDTIEAKQRVALTVTQDVVNVLRGKLPAFLVNKELSKLFD